MIRTTLFSAASLALVSSWAYASPEGLDIWVDISLSTADGDLNVYNSVVAFKAATHTLGGPDTLLTAATDFVTDVIVSSSVSTAGFQRSITIRYDSVTGGTIFMPGIENILPLEDPATLYWMTFQSFVIADPERVGDVQYDYSLLDVDGFDVDFSTSFGGFFGGFGFLDFTSPADPFFGVLVNGFEVTMTYAIPAPAASALLVLGVLGARRRR